MTPDATSGTFQSRRLTGVVRMARRGPRHPESALAEHWTTVDGVDVFYRESPDPPDAPVMIAT